jgi:uncharacterized protein YkwD
LELLNRQRAALGLTPVAPDAALDRAAQRHADDMAANGYFGLTSPTGKDVEQWVGEEGYLAALVAEKLVQAPAAEAPEALAAGWAEARDKNGQSLFHPGVRQIGVGIAARDGAVTYALVLAQPAVEAATLALDATLARLAPVRAEYLERVNAARREAALSPLQHDPRLDRPAQEHAEAVLAALERGDAPDSVESLTERVQAALAGLDNWRGGEAAYVYWKVGKGRIDPHWATLGRSIILDAPSPAAAVEAALTLQPAPDLREAGFRRLGLGIAHGEVAGRPRSVWVAVMLRN